MHLSDAELGVHERRMIFSDDACEVSAVSLEVIREGEQV